MAWSVLKKVLWIAGAILMVSTVTVAFIFNDNNNDDNDDGIETTVSTIELPSNVVHTFYSHYTPSGRIVFQYVDTARNNETYIATMKDDGTDIRDIYKGEIPPKYQSNGIRLMPYDDNKRLLLGDYVMECEPNVDEAQIGTTKLVPIEYPERIVKDPLVMMLWSEIIIAPDNAHIGWSSLHMTLGAIVFIARLVRSSERNIYAMENVQIVSTLGFVQPDPDHDGYILPPKVIRGGEIKQFSHGGTKITEVGTDLQGLTKSVLQDLLEETITPLSHEPGYDETTIISPDGKLGVVMTTRFSPKTSCAIIGLLPRPFCSLAINSIVRYVYTYSVAGVRNFRMGNIGPALIDVNKAINDKDYHGIDLHDSPDQRWVYQSPMSWHKNSLKAIWRENDRRNPYDTRIRKVVISHHKAGDPLPTKETPDNIPYALNLSALDNLPLPSTSGKITGKHSGEIYVEIGLMSTKMIYSNYSDDGKVFVNGQEGVTLDFTKNEQRYEGDVNVTGKEKGEMKFRLTFGGDDTKLLFEIDEKDKLPKSYGKATYNGKTLRVEDMEE